jgi:hypothetical protein
MLNGLGLAEKLKLAFPRSTLANHPDIYVTSLIACASLESSGSSDAFDPARYSMATRCVGDRFVCEMLSSQFDRLRVILILGTHGWTAIQSIRCGSGGTVLQRLRPAGKLVLQLPHPSGQNEEYVGLASQSRASFPRLMSMRRAAGTSIERDTQDTHLAPSEPPSGSPPRALSPLIYM